MGVKWQGAGRRAAVVGVLVAATLGLFSTSPAAEFKMGVIDPQVVLEKSKAGKRALDGLREYVATRQKLLSRDEEELRNTEKQIKEQASKLTDNEKKEKETSFRAKIQDYQKRAQVSLVGASTNTILELSLPLNNSRVSKISLQTISTC